MNISSTISHALIARVAKADAAFFARNCRNTGAIQEHILINILHRSRTSAFGIKHSFDAIKSVNDFRSRVPIRTWEDYAPLMAEAQTTGKPVLTSRPISLYQPTSGTSQSVKFIPATAGLKSEFGRAVNVWLSDLYHRFPRIASGQHYWSISPPAVQQASVPVKDAQIGFDDDAEYLGWRGALVRPVMAVPPIVRKASSVDSFMMATAAYLLAAENLSLISIWNPTYLTVLLNVIDKNADLLIQRIADGTYQLPYSSHARRNRNRAQEIEKGLSHHPVLSPEATSALWPNLSLISCWADGPSAESARRIHHLFPTVTIQPKGLCATEGIISIPLAETDGATAAYTSHFLEFVPVGGGPACGVANLDKGGTYTVILTTSGGLYRYALGDIVRVTGYRDGLPNLVFEGRDRVCDMTGEKLHEYEVARHIDEALVDTGMSAGFHMLAPEKNGEVFRYTLFVEILNADEDQLTGEKQLALSLDLKLRRNFHYDYARNLGQLSSCSVVSLGRNASQEYFSRCLAQGMKAGDIKPVALDRRLTWREWFTASLIERRSTVCTL